jgi:hypothetical protein
MLQEHHLTSAPNSVNVSINTAVYIVIWSDPIILAPFKLYLGPYSYLHDINPGISTSANYISYLPYSCKEMSFILDSIKDLIIDI